ncbi:hypothetical protein GCM10010478_40170 [Streptomyces erythrogriseus]|uniref:Uncharacterized protein n=1 Tax=Streptomyces erythrogriseus TaxID=284027 RepID=A0ABN3X1V7_9ACTN
MPLGTEGAPTQAWGAPSVPRRGAAAGVWCPWAGLGITGRPTGRGAARGRGNRTTEAPVTGARWPAPGRD